MNQMTTAPASFTPASCPLLAAVLPVRYAIGPIKSTASTPAVSAASLQLPEATGPFPELGSDYPQLNECALGYVPRMLRDGWLYVWQEALGQLSEYQVKRALLKPTSRVEPALDSEARAYLILPAGEPVQLVWSPQRWSDPQCAFAKEMPSVRQRIMRDIVPGAGPLSGAVASALSELGDYTPQDYRWSCEPEPKAWLLEEPALRRMKRCEQQFHAIVDDPWGVLLDLAGLVRARKQTFDRLARVRADDWAIASTVKTVSENDDDIRKQLGSLIDVARLEQTLREQERAQDELDADIRRIAALWADWFATLGKDGPATLESACGHFDITQMEARDALEANFAAAMMGPASTSLGVKAIEPVLEPMTGPGKPWLLWAVLGLVQRVGPGDLKQLLQVPENLAPVADELTEGAASLARAAALAAALNHGADKLAGFQPHGGGEPLFAVLSPILTGRLRNLSEQIHSLTYTLMTAMLARSRQRVAAESLSIKDALRWLGAQMGQAHNKGQRHSMEKRLDQMERQEVRANQLQTRSPMAPSPLASQIKEAVPHLRVVPQPPPTPPHPQPGYGSEAPRAVVSKPTAALPALEKVGGGVRLPSIADLLNEAPLKTLIAVVGLWNLDKAYSAVRNNPSAQGILSTVSAGLAVTTATSAILQQLAETDWKRHITRAGHINSQAQEHLARALGVGSAAMLLQAITAGIDVFHYGWQALDAYRAGDLDTSAVNASLAVSNLAYARVSVQAMRAMRIARAAVLAGEAGALATGIGVLTLPLRLTLLGLVVTILVEMALLLFTQDSPLETWFKNTRFGTRPADWSDSFARTLQALYQAIFPVRLTLERWSELNPRNGHLINELRLVIRLPGQTEYRPGMVSLEGYEEWQTERGLLDFGSPLLRCVPFARGEDEPMTLDTGSRVAPEPDGSVRLRRAYHEPEGQTLVRICGTLTYQPVEGISLPPIDIDVS